MSEEEKPRLRDAGEADPSGVYKVCGEHELEHFTMNGWELVRAIESTVLLQVQEGDVVQAFPGQGGGYMNNPSVMSVPRHYPGSITRFLLRKNERSAIREMLKEKSELQSKWDALNKKWMDLSEEKVKTDKRLAHSEEQLKKTLADLQAVLGNSHKQAEKARAMEEDLGKVRKVFGDRAFKEALESP